MIKVLIIEDEIPARKKIRRFLEELSDEVDFFGEIDTVANAISFLQSNRPDLIISDIELLDGNVFEAYQVVSVKCPIIFTTAYDDFWMHAFETNGISYLLKPFSKEKFQKAWEKFLLFKKVEENGQPIIDKLSALVNLHLSRKEFKKRFTVQKGQGLYFLNTDEISFFQANEGVVYAFDQNGKKHLLAESTLKEIEDQLNPEDFFRVNRGELVHKLFVEKVERFKKNTLLVKMRGFDTFLETSQTNTASFRSWIER